MVDRSRAGAVAVTVLAVALAACIALYTAGPSTARDDEDVQVTLEYRIVVNEVGDAHIKGTFTLSEDLFKVIAKIAKKNPEYLTRRYTGYEGILVVKKPKARVDESRNAIIVSYDCPGYAYNWKDHWEIKDFKVKPKEISGNRLRFAELYKGRGDLTLHVVMPVKRIRNVVLPKKAKGVRHNAGSNAIEYRLDGPKTTYGFFTDNKLLLSTLFGILALLFTGLLFLVLFRIKAERVPSEAGAGPSQGSEVLKRHCPGCGAEVPVDNRFCTRCGKRV